MGFLNPKRSNAIWLLAHNEGDNHFKSVIQQIELKFPIKNTEGANQQIDFEAIPNLSKTPKFIPLHATSSTNLPVDFYVKDGPAFISGNQLVFTKIPPKTKYPVKVTIVAWQYGIAGKIKSAQPVEQSFFLHRH